LLYGSSQRQDKRGRGGSSPCQWRGEWAVLARERREEQQSTALHFKEHAAGMVHTSASARASACLTLALLPAESVASSLISLISLMSVPGEVWAGARRTCEGQHAPIECNETRRQRPYISSDGSIGLGLTVRAGMEA
jgi:hypothetical protein